MRLSGSWKCLNDIVIELFFYVFFETDIMEGCNSKQYLEYGKPGTIQCVFIDFFGVFWYNSTDVERTPMLSYKKSEKSGDGFSSKEFDILTNGSLVINNVSLRHDHVISVVMMKTKYADALVVNVSVYVIGLCENA